MFPPKKKPAFPPAKPKPAMDDLESPDPVEGKPAPDPAEESAESPDEESGEDYGAKFVSDMIAPLISLGMDKKMAKSTLAAQLRAGADCLDGGDGEDSGLDESGGDDGATAEPMGGRYGR